VCCTPARNEVNAKQQLASALLSVACSPSTGVCRENGAEDHRIKSPKPAVLAGIRDHGCEKPKHVVANPAFQRRTKFHSSMQPNLCRLVNTFFRENPTFRQGCKKASVENRAQTAPILDLAIC
jgi:hypothetical protein